MTTDPPPTKTTPPKRRGRDHTATFEGTTYRIPTEEELEREKKAIELRLAGVTYARIAVEIGVGDHGTARRIFLRALGRIHQGPATEARQLESERLDRLQRAVWAKALSGDLGAVDRALRVMRQRAELLGLNHSHGIAERALQLEADRVRLVAVAFGKALEAGAVPVEAREEMTRVLLRELRAADVVDGEVVEGDGA